MRCLFVMKMPCLSSDFRDVRPCLCAVCPRNPSITALHESQETGVPTPPPPKKERKEQTDLYAERQAVLR